MRASRKRCARRGIDAHSFNAALLFEPWDIATAKQTPTRCSRRSGAMRARKLEVAPAAARAANDRMRRAVGTGARHRRARVCCRGFRGMQVSAKSGRLAKPARTRRCNRFLEVARRGVRDSPRLSRRAGTSRLSPHLHFGEISPMQIVAALEAASHGSAKHRAGGEAYLRELGWREFSHHLLYHFPRIGRAQSQSRVRRISVGAHIRRAARALATRQNRLSRSSMPACASSGRPAGCTTACACSSRSFLTKNLRQHWLTGARWFWDTLVDADLANNTQGWQWTAGSGADASPYFRIFNPVTQGERFDPDGEYVRRWVPELAAFEGKAIHTPWTDPARLRASGYPRADGRSRRLARGRARGVPRLQSAAPAARRNAEHAERRR